GSNVLHPFEPQQHRRSPLPQPFRPVPLRRTMARPPRPRLRHPPHPVRQRSPLASISPQL
ncbi:MAG: hypothetical protein AVDCRST_MAG77-6106, partial [uncultured Chloroflexi bacterium]